MAEPTPLLLIHGAWAGSWVWDALLPGLRQAGFNPVAVDLPGNGHTLGEAHDSASRNGEASLEAYLRHLQGVMAELDGPITLIAHSGGGVVATELAERNAERITAVVYIAGMMLPSGMRFADLVGELREAHPEVGGIQPYLQWTGDRRSSRVPPEAARRIFFQQADEASARAAALRLTPQPQAGRDIVAHWTPARFGQLPRLYVEARHDRSVVPVLQRRMQQLVPGAEVVSLSSDHAPQLSAPASLLEALVPFLKRRADQPFHADRAAP